MSEAATREAVEGAVRNSYGRLVAFLAARSGDVASAEDALGDALVAALEKWPATGVPEKPEAWLLHVARNRLIDAARRHEEAQTVAAEDEAFPDERLKLLFVCAHPAIDITARTPLMLQTVLGIDAVRITARWFVAALTMTTCGVNPSPAIARPLTPFPR